MNNQAVVISTIPKPRKDDLEQMTSSLSAAVTFFTFYLSIFNPEDVYGVPVNSRIAFLIAAIFLVVVTIGFAIVGYH